jgi:hypothetical protein
MSAVSPRNAFGKAGIHCSDARRRGPAGREQPLNITSRMRSAEFLRGAVQLIGKGGKSFLADNRGLRLTAHSNRRKSPGAMTLDVNLSLMLHCHSRDRRKIDQIRREPIIVGCAQVRQQAMVALAAPSDTRMGVWVHPVRIRHDLSKGP